MYLVLQENDALKVVSNENKGQRKDIDTEGYVKTPPSSLFGYTLLVSVADF